MTAAPRLPPDDPLLALADRCVQCGLCLPACPTYRVERLEAQSPRGRIALVRAWARGTVPPTPAGDRHLDDCLGCRNCEAACPAGAPFGELLVRARARQRARRAPGVRQRLVEHLVTRPRLLAFLLQAYSLVARALPRRWRPLPPVPGRRSGPGKAGPLRGGDGPAPPAGLRSVTGVAGPDAPAAAMGARDTPPAPTPASPGVARDRGPSPPDPAASPPAAPDVALFVGCAARAYEPAVREALVRLGRAAGVGITVPDGQGCCGALHAHSGDAGRAASLGRATSAAFAGCTTVATLASGCHEAVARALPPGRAVDALDLLAARRDRLRFRSTPERVALHLPCTQRNVVGSVPALMELLAAVPDLDVVPLAAGHGCCGASGSTLLVDPARACAYRAPLVDALHASGASRLLSANLGCRLHLAGGTALPVLHPLEFLDECLAPGADVAALD